MGKADSRKKASGKTNHTRLLEMIEEATVDCYDESEQKMGLFSMVEENLALPFETIVLGIPVSVESVELDDVGGIVAVCVRGKNRQRIQIVDLPLPHPPPVGAEWIDAYRLWAKGR